MDDDEVDEGPEIGLWRWTRTFDRLTTSREETRPRDSSEFRLDNQHDSVMTCTIVYSQFLPGDFSCSLLSRRGELPEGVRSAISTRPRGVSCQLTLSETAAVGWVSNLQSCLVLHLQVHLLLRRHLHYRRLPCRPACLLCR